MYGTLEIGGKTLELTANAATPFRVKQVFNIDIMKTFFDSQTDGGISASSVIPELTYIMNCQALKKDMSKLNMNTFYEWCEDFGPMEIIEKAEDILAIYLGNQQVTSKAKKNKEP